MAQLDSWRIFCDSIRLSWSEHLNARPYVQWIHYESLHLLLGMEIPDPITPLPRNQKHRRELGYSKELAWNGWLCSLTKSLEVQDHWKWKPYFLNCLWTSREMFQPNGPNKGGLVEHQVQFMLMFRSRVLKSPVDVPSVNQHSNGIISPFSIRNVSYRVHFPASYVM